MPSALGLSVGSTLLSAKKLVDKPPLEVELLTVRLMLTLYVRLLDVPVTVMLEVPVMAVAEAVSVSELELVVEAGLNEAVTPVGRPDAERATDPLNPPEGTTVMLSV